MTEGISGADASPIHYEVVAGVATVTINSPERRNVLDATSILGMREALAAAAADAAVRVVVLTGAGNTFCAGADLSGATCTSGTCRCPTGQIVCGASTGVPGTCVDTASNSANCGSCGTACPTGQVCASSTCGTVCGSGLTACSGAGCRNLTNDINHCGMCGRACSFLRLR